LIGAETGIKAITAVHCQCRSWVNRVTLAVCRSLPVFPNKQTSSDRLGMSESIATGFLSTKVISASSHFLRAAAFTYCVEAVAELEWLITAMDTAIKTII
jgi:carbon starvation protein CstA